MINFIIIICKGFQFSFLFLKNLFIYELSYSCFRCLFNYWEGEIFLSFEFDGCCRFIAGPTKLLFKDQPAKC